MKSGNLNFLEPSGPLQACNGTALPFLQHYYLSEVPHFQVSHHTLFQNAEVLVIVTPRHKLVRQSLSHC